MLLYLNMYVNDHTIWWFVMFITFSCYKQSVLLTYYCIKKTCDLNCKPLPFFFCSLFISLKCGVGFFLFD